MEISKGEEQKNGKKSVDFIKVENAEGSDVEIIQRKNVWSYCLAILRAAKVEPAMFGLFLATALSDTVITNLILARTCQVTLQYNSSICNLLGDESDEGKNLEKQVQPITTYIVMGKNLISTILPALLSFYLGPWSDRNGRRPLLLSALIGNALTYALYALLALIANLPPTYLLFAGIPLALSGGNINAITSAHCYVSDTTKQEDRIMRLGLIGGAIFTGLITGNLLSNRVFSINKEHGFVITFCSSALIFVLTFLYTFFLVPETVVKNDESKGITGIFRTELLKEMWHCLVKKRENNGRAILFLATFSLASCVVIIEAEHNVKYLFTRIQFKWDFAEFQRYMAIHTLIVIIGAVIGLVVLAQYLKVNEFLLQIVAFTMRGAESLYYFALTPDDGYLMYYGGLVGFLGGIVIPTMRSILTNTVPKEDIGKVFSLTFSVESLVPTAMNPIYIYLYNSTIQNMPGAFLLLNVALNVINVIWFGYIYGLIRFPSQKKDEEKITEDANKAEEVKADYQIVYS